MHKKHWLILVVAVLLVVSLPACQRSASTAPAATPTGEGNVPFPTPLPNDNMQNAVSGTQTAEAIKKATLNPVLPTNTLAPVVANPTNTPLPLATNTPAPQVVVPTATPGRPSSYTLQKGEFPFCIARRYNVDVATLLSTNGLTINSKPPIGTVLKIPQTGSWSGSDRALKTHPASYTVQTGDSIYSVACLFGDVDPNALIVANSLKDPYTLTAGQSIQIP